MVTPRLINDDLRAVAELFAFLAANPVEARRMLGPSPGQQVTDAHAAGWFRQVSRIPHQPALNAGHYVDDHALAQIPAALPLLGLPREQQMQITRGDGTQMLAHGLDDPQAMRMILLQILTGRRASEIRTCAFDCLSPVPDRATATTEDTADDRDADAESPGSATPKARSTSRRTPSSSTARSPQVIEEQQQWIRERLRDIEPRFLFVQRTGQPRRPQALPVGHLRLDAARVQRHRQDHRQQGAAGRAEPHPPVPAHQADPPGRARPAHPRPAALRRARQPDDVDALHRRNARSTPSRRSWPPRSSGPTAPACQFSREDHDSLHLFDRADRFLPHGWCLLPPLQTCDKGNACLTCSVFVTDQTHQTALQRQLAETEELIARSTAAFHQRHGRPMPDDNVWLAQRHAEHAALTRLLATMSRQPRTSGAGRRLRHSPRHQRPGPAHPRSHPPSKDPVMTDAARAPHRHADRRRQGQVPGEDRRSRTGDPPPGQARRAGHLPGRPARGRRLPRLPLRPPRPARTHRAPPRPDPPHHAAAGATGRGEHPRLALTSQINHLKKQHRQQVQALRAALEQAHGENLDLRRELARRGSTGQPAAPADHAASIATT